MSKKIAIIMALFNKNEALPNVLHSIKQQKTSHQIKMCFLDDMSIENPLPLINEFFNEGEVVYKREKVNGFQLIPKKIAKLIPEDTDYVFYQSSDIIWLDENLLELMISPLEKKGKIVITKLTNVAVDPNAYKDPANFKQNVLSGTNDLSKYGDTKRPEYIYLGAMNKEDFYNISDHLNEESFACDLILRERVNKQLQYIKIDSLAIHQRHVNQVHQCTSIDVCSIPCVQKEYSQKNTKFPITLGTYNLKYKKYM